MDKEYQVTRDESGFRWEWLNFLCGKFPYTTWRGTNYPFNTLLGSSSTARAAFKKIEKDKTERQAKVIYQGKGEW